LRNETTKVAIDIDIHPPSTHTHRQTYRQTFDKPR
jgi:hypothetical protein